MTDDAGGDVDGEEGYDEGDEVEMCAAGFGAPNTRLVWCIRGSGGDCYLVGALTGSVDSGLRTVVSFSVAGCA